MIPLPVFVIQNKPKELFPVSWGEAASMLIHMPYRAVLRLQFGESQDLVLDICKVFLHNRCLIAISDSAGRSGIYVVTDRKPLGNEQIIPIFTDYGIRYLCVAKADADMLLSCVTSFVLEHTLKGDPLVDPLPEAEDILENMINDINSSSFENNRHIWAKRLRERLAHIPLFACRYQQSENEKKYPEGPTEMHLSVPWD